MPKSKHRKKHKHALSNSKKPGGVLAGLIDSLIPVAPVGGGLPLPSGKKAK